VDPGEELSADRAAELPAAHGPNTLREEGTKPGRLRFLDRYRSSLRISLVASAVVAPAIAPRSC
jgi:hypothetical protein